MTFKEWGGLLRRWRLDDHQCPGKKEEIRCEWILDKSFIRLTWKTSAESPGRVSRHRPRDRSMDHLGLRQQGPGL